MMRLLPIMAALAIALGGCALKDAPTRPELMELAFPEHIDLPPQWRAGQQPDTVAGDWLALFNDPALAAIIAEAMAHNLDLRQAAQGVLIAEQNLVRVGAQLLPQVGAEAGAKVLREHNVSSTNDSTLAYASASWELDLWGRLRSERAAAAARYEATALDYDYARQSLAAITAKTWYLAIETRQLVDVEERSVAVFQELLRLAQARRSSGKDSDLDVVDVRANLELAKSQLELTRQLYSETRRSLEVLLGRYPAAEIEVASLYPHLPPPPDTDVPASLLERRLDILSAEQAVLAAFRQQEAARLALLPDFSISLNGGRLTNEVLSTLDRNPWIAMAGIDALIPIYQGGALRAVEQITTAQQARSVAQYGATVLNAFREVENALANEQSLARRIPLEESALQNRTAAVDIATKQYRAGRRDLLWVAQLQTAQILVESDVVKLRSTQAINRIQLYLALGGRLVDPPPPATDKDGDTAG
jgi:NodT family efflux transporter outer membrane factor (OMF) lipoprotein